ncbi:MAG: inositol monophosphatase [Woeseiaceae bacterium]
MSSNELQHCIDEFIRRFVPAIQTAGDYALAIQASIGQREIKQGDAWTSVLTDADLGVQHFFEAIMLAEFPDWNFFGEEHAMSFNTRFFETQSTTVWLDPVNGTRMYKDGADSFDVLLSLTISGQLAATLSYMPARKRIFGATRTQGAFTIDTRSNEKCQLRVQPAPLTLTLYQADHWRDALHPDIDVVDFVTDYAPDNPACCLNNVLTGQLGGFLFGATPLLDVGATAFTVSQAGGIACLPNGQAFNYFERFNGEQPADLLVCANPELAKLVTQSLRD